MDELVADDSLQQQHSASLYTALGNDRDTVETAVADTFALGSTQRQLKRRSTIKKKTTLLDINAYRQRQNLNSLEEALLSIIQENDRVSYPEERVIVHVTEYLLEGANIECTDVYGNTPLHQAAWMGFPDLTKELVQRGANVHALNHDGQTPMEIAISKGLELDDERTEDYSRVAAVVIKEMEPAKVRELFLASSSETCTIKFRELLCNQEMQDATEAVLDTLIERTSQKAIKVHYSLLEADDNGDIQPGKGSTLKYIVDTENKDVLIHPAVTLLAESKWRRFARNTLILKFIYWAVTMTILSAALLLGATSTNSTLYITPVDYFRAVCEGLMILLITISFIRDILLISKVRRRFFTEYTFFMFIYFNILTAILLYVYIILHALKVQERWFVAAIAFFLYALKGLRFLLTIRFMSSYFLILAKIIKYDIFTFLAVFTFILLATAGSLNMEARLLTVPSPNSTLQYNFPTLALIGLRMMIEGDRIVDYTGFEWLGYGTYLVFMFFVVVVLQSLLIAQMSDTFTNVQVDVKRTLILNRARTILNIEETTNVKKLPWISKLLKFARIKLNVLTEEIWKDPGEHLKKVELPESVINIKKLTKLEKMMNTQRELVEELRSSITCTITLFFACSVFIASSTVIRSILKLNTC